MRRISSEVVVEGLEAEYCRGLNGEHRFDIYSEVEVAYQSAPQRRAVSQLLERSWTSDRSDPPIRA
jgi:hypothetical protein